MGAPILETVSRSFKEIVLIPCVHRAKSMSADLPISRSRAPSIGGSGMSRGAIADAT